MRHASFNWKTSSYSPSRNGDCVEAGASLDGTFQYAVRDSKNRGGTALLFSSVEWAAFVRGIKAGDFPS
ncbi:DUF397 domain-containing protein [Salinactinospora qingdaonensis]|uniref:DUF397 domain-containing protein n=1 Tax=Salinactinospora qingdaonensis TaxID=702744 RepID=A0ABP7G0G5_9ACTN